MFFYSCLACRIDLKRSFFISNPLEMICEDCIANFSFLSSSACGLSLLPYHSKMRHLIIESKIGLSYQHQKALMEFLLSHFEVKNLVKKASFLVASPSSLYSRLRGRVDLADLMADELQKAFGIKRCFPPFSAFFRVKKRSQMMTRTKNTLENYAQFQFKKKEEYFLIVDDVVTSGHTILQTASYWPDKKAKYLTLASAL